MRGREKKKVTYVLYRFWAGAEKAKSICLKNRGQIFSSEQNFASNSNPLSK